jgi:heptosyltransferase II
MRIGVFLPNWIGDVVMATPALRALRKLAGPEGRLIGIMRPYVADVLAGTTWLDEAILYKPKTDNPEHQWATARRKLRSEHLDAAVLLTNSLRTAWMAWRSGARQRIGFARNMRSWLLTKKLRSQRAGERRYEDAPIDAYLQLAAAAGTEAESRRLELATTPADEVAADNLWQRLTLNADERPIVFNPGGGFGPSKWWPPEHFAVLAQRFVGEMGLRVVVNCGPTERDLARQIVTLAASPLVTSMADFDVPLGLSKAVIKRSRLLVTTDSGPRFFGVAFERPVVSLFGPTSPTATPTYYDQETTLSLSLDCQPCMQRECPLVHHNCLRELTVDMVFKSAARYL